MHCSQSGVTDYLAQDDTHALHLARNNVEHLHLPQPHQLNLLESEEPLYPPSELGGVVGTDLTRPFDMREVRGHVLSVGINISFLFSEILLLKLNFRRPCSHCV